MTSYDICLSVWLHLVWGSLSRFIHVAKMAWFHSFLWLSNIPLCVCVCVCVCIPHLFIHSSVNGHLGYFHVLAIVNIGVHVSVHSFKAYNSLVLSIFPYMCNHQQFNSRKFATLHPLAIMSYSHHHLPWPLVITNLLSVSWICLVWTCHMNRIIQCVTFCD